MSGENVNDNPIESSGGDKWEQMAEEVRTDKTTEASQAEDESPQYETWLRSNLTEQPTIERTGDDLADAKAAEAIAWKEYFKTNGESPDNNETFDKWRRASNAVRGVEEAREKYLQNTPEENYELASKFGKIESAGFDQPVPEGVGTIADDGISKEVYPQLDGESDAAYYFRITRMEEESKRHEQGDRLTDANIAEAAAWMDFLEDNGENHQVFKRWDLARNIAIKAKKLHDEGKI